MLPLRLHSSPGRLDLLWTAAVTGAALMVFFLWQPGEFVLCPFRRLTGWLCPLCGLTHGLCAVAHGEWRRALSFHLLSPLLFAVIAATFLLSVVRLVFARPAGAPPRQARYFHVGLALLALHWLWRLAGLPLP